MALKNKYDISLVDESTAGILDEMQRLHSFSGEIDLQYLRLPDPWRSMQQERGDAQLYLTKYSESNEAMGYGSVIYKDHFLNEEKVKIGYLGNLKVLEKFHRRFIPLHHSYNTMFSNRPPNASSIYISTILESNQKAIKILSANKSFMPEYHFIGNYTTNLFSGGKKRKFKDLNFRELLPEEHNHYMRLYENENAQFDFSSVINYHFIKKIITESKARLYGLIASGELLAAAILVDPSGYKQTIVRDYSGKYKYRTLLNTNSSLKSLPYFPPSGSKLPLHYLSYIAVKDANPDYLSELLLGTSALLKRKDMLVLGFCERHPYQESISKINAIRYPSRMFVVNPRTEEESYKVDDKRIPHFECLEL